MKRIIYLITFIILITIVSCDDSLYREINDQPICPCKIISITNHNFNSNYYFIITYESRSDNTYYQERSFRTKNTNHYIGEIVE